MIFAARMNSVRPSATFAVNALASRLKAQGRDVIPLGVGEPDFETPKHVVDAAIKALAEGKTKYTPVNGIPELRKALCRKFLRDNGLDYSLDEVTVACGGKQIIANAFLATVDVGDQVIIPAPYWVSYPEITRLCGGTPVFVQCGPDQAFKLRPDQLERAITPQSKWIVLNSPSNPTGAVYSRQELEPLLEVVARHPEIFVLSDEIYEHLIFDNLQYVSTAVVRPDLRSRILTVNGASKGYCMTGWRVGFGAGPEQLIKAMDSVQSQLTAHTATVSQYAALAALNGSQEYIKHNAMVFRERRDVVIAMLNNAKGISCVSPSGAFYVFASCAGTLGRKTPEGTRIIEEADFVRYLLESHGVAVVPGAAFGLSPHFRLSYATALDTLREACRRIQSACAELT
jgi:aspartate aminotransferase